MTSKTPAGKKGASKTTTSKSDAAVVKEDIESGQHTLYSFQHSCQVMRTIESFPTICKNKYKCEAAIESLVYIADLYQEQPHLLDKHLETIFNKILDPIVNLENCDDELIKVSFSALHPFIKVRGYKRAVRYLPHDVTNLERVLALLEKQDINNPTTWATRYCLLLWLSVVAIVPFDLERFSRQESSDSDRQCLNRLIQVGKKYLLCSGR